MAGELPVEFGEKRDAVGEAKPHTGGGGNMDRKHVKGAADKVKSAIKDTASIRVWSTRCARFACAQSRSTVRRCGVERTASRNMKCCLRNGDRHSACQTAFSIWRRNFQLACTRFG